MYGQSRPAPDSRLLVDGLSAVKTRRIMWKVLRITSSYWGRQMPSLDDDSVRSLVLLVEAHPWLSDFLAEALADEGYAVAQAHDGNGAFMLAEQRAPSAIALDPRALDMSVEQFLGQLSANPAIRSIPVGTAPC